MTRYIIPFVHDKMFAHDSKIEQTDFRATSRFGDRNEYLVQIQYEVEHNNDCCDVISTTRVQPLGHKTEQENSRRKQPAMSVVCLCEV